MNRHRHRHRHQDQHQDQRQDQHQDQHPHQHRNQHRIQRGTGGARGGGRALALALLLAAALLGLPGAGAAAAEAGTSVEQAKQHLQTANALYEKGDYRQALEEFGKGYELSRKPGFLFNMSECARLLGDKVRAYGLYVHYLAQHPTGKHRKVVLERCKELKLGRCLPVQTGAPASPGVPGARGAPGAPAASPALGLRPATISLPAPGPSDAHLTAAPFAPLRPRRPFYKRWPFWVGIGAAVVAGSVTAAVLATRSTGGASPAGNTATTFDLRLR